MTYLIYRPYGALSFALIGILPIYRPDGPNCDNIKHCMQSLPTLILYQEICPNHLLKFFQHMISLWGTGQIYFSLKPRQGRNIGRNAIPNMVIEPRRGDILNMSPLQGLSHLRFYLSINIPARWAL